VPYARSKRHRGVATLHGLVVLQPNYAFKRTAGRGYRVY
jgi:hypothetical protein